MYVYGNKYKYVIDNSYIDKSGNNIFSGIS